VEQSKKKSGAQKEAPECKKMQLDRSTLRSKIQKRGTIQIYEVCTSSILVKYGVKKILFFLKKKTLVSNEQKLKTNTKKEGKHCFFKGRWSSFLFFCVSFRCAAAVQARCLRSINKDRGKKCARSSFSAKLLPGFYLPGGAVKLLRNRAKKKNNNEKQEFSYFSLLF
jgi:hypothetical protein